MALNDPYATLPELKNYVNSKEDKVTYDDLLSDALEAASRGIELVCDRQFNDVGLGPWTPRVFYGDGTGVLEVDDFSSSSGLVIRLDTNDDDTFATTLDVADFRLHPRNGIVGGQPGWPFSELWHRRGRWWEQGVAVEVTARWGWTEVPLPVKQATLMCAAELYKTKDAPFGVAGNNAQYGAIRVRENPLVMSKLHPYMRNPVLVA